MRRPPADVPAAVDAAARRELRAHESVEASVVGVAVRSRPLGRTPLRALVVTDQRLLVLAPRPGGRFALSADYPRSAVAVTATADEDGRGALLVLELAGDRLRLHVPSSDGSRAAALVRALGGMPDGRLVASLGPVDLTRQSRRALGIGRHERAAVVVTDRDLVFLARRGPHTKVATRYPRRAVRVVDHRTVWPGGDVVFERIAIKAGDATVRFGLDGRMHARAEAVVAALGGMPAG